VKRRKLIVRAVAYTLPVVRADVPVITDLATSWRT
jgi:hypothetical protein